MTAAEQIVAPFAVEATNSCKKRIVLVEINGCLIFEGSMRC